MTEISSALPPEAKNVSQRGFNLHNGPIFEIPGDSAIPVFAFVPERRHMNSGDSVHGGMLMGFADIAMSRTTRAVTGAQRSATVSMTCDFVGPGKEGEMIEAHVRVIRKTRTIVFLSADIRQGGRTLAVATGLWKYA